jgi:predicted nucleotidyltransferase
MARRRGSQTTLARKRIYRSPHVPQSAIRRFAREVVVRFRPEKIVLFGSNAYGRPHDDSDVDILVVMPARNEIDQSIRIWNAIEPPFLLDLIVRTPHNLQWHLAEGDWFLREVMARGQMLYEKTHRRLVSQGRGRPHPGAIGRKRPSTSG